MGEALAAVDAASDGWLALSDRRVLREAFGPWTPPDEPAGPDAGLLRRAELMVLCVRRALPRWEEAFPDDRRPHEVVAATVPVLMGTHHEAELDARAEELRDEVERLGSAPDAGAAFFAGAAAVSLPAQAWNGDLEPDLYPPDEDDRETDLSRVESLAAQASAFGDASATRSFWRWYVSEAFPAAYRAVPDDGGWIDGR